MTRLEKIEWSLRKAQLSPARYTTLRTNDLRDFQYALDCYRARVAVLEEAIQSAEGRLIDDAARIISSALALTPEQCLERVKGAG